MRMLPALAAICLIAFPATAADPKIELAAKVFQSLGSDPGKVKTFCEMTKAMDSAWRDRPIRPPTAKIESCMTQLGPDFQKAWDAGGGDRWMKTPPTAKPLHDAATRNAHDASVPNEPEWRDARRASQS